jgi:hypothetical protein
VCQLCFLHIADKRALYEQCAAVLQVRGTHPLVWPWRRHASSIEREDSRLDLASIVNKADRYQS